MGTRGVTLARGEVFLRPLRKQDESEWLSLRADNRAWLRPWEATPPPGSERAAISFRAYLKREEHMWAERRAFGFVIQLGTALVGRVSVSGIEWGAECGGSLGYWVAQGYAGRGLTPTAVALASEYAFKQGVHRLEIAVRPENMASIRVAQKLGYREEGLRKRYLYIDADWRDHRVFALTADEPRPGPFWGDRPMS